MFFVVNPVKESLIKSIEEFVQSGWIDLSELDEYMVSWIEIYSQILRLLDIHDIYLDALGEDDDGSYVQATVSVDKGSQPYFIIFNTDVGTYIIPKENDDFTTEEEDKINSIAIHLSEVILGANRCRKDFNIVIYPEFKTYIVNCNGCGVTAQVAVKQGDYCCKSCAVKNNLISKEEEELFGESVDLI